MKIRIVSKGLPKAQMYNSQIGAPSFPKFQQSVTQMTSGKCPDGYQKNPFTGECEPKPTFGVTTPPQIQTNLGQGFVRNPSTGTYSAPAQPRYPAGIYKGTPSQDTPEKKNKFASTMFDISRVIDTATTVGGIASDFYTNYIQGGNKQINQLQKYAALPDLQSVGTMSGGMFTTNQARLDPRNQYSPNQGQTTNLFYPTMPFMAQDGIEMTGPSKVQRAFLPNPNAIFPLTLPSFSAPEASAVPAEVPTAPVTAETAEPVMESPVQPISESKPKVDQTDLAESKKESDSKKYVFPLKEYKITSKFGKRQAPVRGASTTHNGVDLAVSPNTPVLSPFDGVVEKLYTNNAGGKQLIIRHSDGSKSGFAHLNDYNVGVGDRVTKGQAVALTGNTGKSTGAHLHFTWRDANGKLRDPLEVFNMTKPDTKKSTQVSVSHNNPLNIHYGNFAKKYGAKPGTADSNGNVAMFPTFEDGVKANIDLLFGPSYINLTIAEARNRWVTGNKNKYTNSTNYIVKEMGGNKKLNELTIAEREKLFKQFAKWEGKQGYNLIKDKRIFNGEFEEGGEIDMNNTSNTNTMKIRIVSGPMNKMKYGGQLGYGFDLGQRNTYSAMNQDSFEEATQRLKPVPREEANIEAERDETALGDFDGDGMLEHKVIGGERHSNGGTPLNVPKGTFIFSDTAKMKIKDKSILKYFGVGPKKGGYTPAEIAKRFDLNKYKAMLESPLTNNMEKNTAKLMLDEYQKKLGYLSLVQESKKGFPQGMPKVAESVTGQFGGEASFGTQSPEINLSARAGGTVMPLPQAQAGIESISPMSPVDWFQFPLMQNIDPNTYSDYPTGALAVPRTLPNVAITGTRRRFKGEVDREPKERVARRDPSFPTDLAPLATPTSPFITGRTPGLFRDAQSTAFEEPAEVPAVPDITTTSGDYTRTGFSPQAKIALTNALANLASVRGYDINYQRAKFTAPDAALLDYLDKTQQRQQAYARSAETLATALPGQRLASNLSFLQGQTGEGAASDIAQTNLQNALIKTRNAEMQANILNNEIQYNTGITNEERKDKLALLRKKDADRRTARQAVAAALIQGKTEQDYTDWFNAVESPYYYIDPRTRAIKFRSEAAKAAFEAAKKRGLSGQSGNDVAGQLGSQLAAIKKATGASNKEAIQLLRLLMGDKSAGSSKTSSKTASAKYGYNYYNPYMG